MLSSLMAKLIFLLSLLQLALASSSPDPVAGGAAAAAANLELRDDNNNLPSTSIQTAQCLDYERTANLSIIGAIGAYRTAFLQKSNVGTMYNARMLDAAIAKLPMLKADKALNEACGNWTQIAIDGAKANYTQGIVAQFSTEGLPVGIKAGPIIIVVVAVICILFSTLWVFII